MTKQEILDEFYDINYVYNTSSKHETLSWMLDELLKEQEAVKPKLVGPSMWRCGKCDELLGWEDFTPSGVELVEYKFCPGCGKKVKWE